MISDLLSCSFIKKLNYNYGMESELNRSIPCELTSVLAVDPQKYGIECGLLVSHLIEPGQPILENATLVPWNEHGLARCHLHDSVHWLKNA